MNTAFPCLLCLVVVEGVALQFRAGPREVGASGKDEQPQKATRSMMGGLRRLLQGNAYQDGSIKEKEIQIGAGISMIIDGLKNKYKNTSSCEASAAGSAGNVSENHPASGYIAGAKNT